MPNNQAVVKHNPQGLQAVDSNDSRINRVAKLAMSDVKQLADAFYASGSFPDLKSEAAAAVKIIAGHELGFSPVVSMTGIHFFQGKVVIGANLLASLIKDSGKYEYKIMEHTNETCSIVFYQRFGEALKQMGVPVTYTIADAKKAGLDQKDNWKKFPKDMLFAACVRQGARRYCADILRGTSTEHANPYETEIDAHDAENASKSAPADVDGEVVDDSPQTHFDENESVLIDLRAAVLEKLGEVTGGDEKAMNELLKGRPASINDMSREELQNFYDDLASM